MPKLKTHKGLSKRVKVTGSGKVKRKKCGMGHLMSCKSAGKRRSLAKGTLVAGAKATQCKILLNA